MNKVNQFNNFLAEKSTLVFGTMWTFYIFFFYSLLPLIPFLTQYQNQLFYWSGWVQLWALPLLMVGQNVLGRNAEQRAQQDHEMIVKEFSEIKELLELERNENQELHMIFDELSNIIKQLNKQ